MNAKILGDLKNFNPKAAWATSEIAFSKAIRKRKHSLDVKYKLPKVLGGPGIACVTEALGRKETRNSKWKHLDWQAAREKEANKVIKQFNTLNEPIERDDARYGASFGSIHEVHAVKHAETPEPENSGLVLLPV